MNVMIDTCIVIDALQSREPFCKNAEEIFLLCANNKCKGFLAANSVTDIYYLTHKQTHSNEATHEIMKKLCTLFSILDTSAADIRKALDLKNKDFEDAVMIEASIRANMDCIITRNKKDYTLSPIPVYSPSEFIMLVEANANH